MRIMRGRLVWTLIIGGTLVACAPAPGPPDPAAGRGPIPPADVHALVDLAAAGRMDEVVTRLRGSPVLHEALTTTVGTLRFADAAITITQNGADAGSASLVLELCRTIGDGPTAVIRSAGVELTLLPQPDDSWTIAEAHDLGFAPRETCD